MFALLGPGFVSYFKNMLKYAMGNMNNQTDNIQGYSSATSTDNQSCGSKAGRPTTKKFNGQVKNVLTAYLAQSKQQFNQRECKDYLCTLYTGRNQ